MEANQQPNALHLAQELKAGEWSPNILQNEVALRQCAADELLRLHAENTALQSGYDAARLEVESLKKALAEHIETRTPSNHAGVIMWVGDCRVARHLSEVELRNWRLPSDVLFLLANSCISTLAQHLNQQTKYPK